MQQKIMSDSESAFSVQRNAINATIRRTIPQKCYNNFPSLNLAIVQRSMSYAFA